jgi:hypothetical protein
MLTNQINNIFAGLNLIHWAPKIRFILLFVMLVLSLFAPELALAEGVEGGVGGG